MSGSEPQAYADASALVKLAINESETPALEAFLQPYRIVSSDIATTEVVRAVLRSDEHAFADALAALASVVLIAPSEAILRAAGLLLPRTLRSLDAIHIASALDLGADLDVLVTYDTRMREAAELAGLRVAAPA